MSQELHDAGIPVEHHDAMNQLLGAGISFLDLIRLYQLLRPYADMVGPALSELVAFAKSGQHTAAEWITEGLKIIDMVIPKLPKTA